MDRVVAHVEFLGGAMRPVYEQPDGRQYVHDDDGEQVFGVWFIPREEPEADAPAIVEPRQ